MWQIQKEKYKIYLLFQMSRSLKCFNPTCKCGNIELERVLKIRCKNCHCSIIYDIEKVIAMKGECCAIQQWVHDNMN